MTTGNLTERSLKVLRNYTANWPGRKFGQHGIATLANEGGTRPPLIWIFNATHEFPALAEELGPDQPLIGLRSLHAVVSLEKRSVRDEQPLAACYAAEVAEALEGKPCFVGGNCQGAKIAGELGRELLLAGREIKGFIGMEWSDLPPLPVRCTLLFGAWSEEHNPFLRGLEPWPMWRSLFPAVECRFLPGRHGTYFEPARLSALGQRVQYALSLPPVPSRDGPAPRPDDLPACMVAGGRHRIRLTTTGRLEVDDMMAALWSNYYGAVPCGLPHRQRAALRHASDDTAWFDLVAPEVRGGWTLQLFLCREGRGPLAWSTDARRSWDVVVT